MPNFTPCQGKNACRDDGVLCLTCGRKLSEITKLRDLMSGLTELAIDYEFENVDEYAQYVARKIVKMVEYRRAEEIS
jgi:predicted Fe-S protein YdhL (DUF1289 family)